MDLYNADVAGSWGQVTMLSSTQFSFACKVVVGDGQNLTYFSDSAKQVTFVNNTISATNQKCLAVLQNSSLTLGVLVTEKRTWKGCDLLDLNTGYNHYLIYQQNGNVSLYSMSAKAVMYYLSKVECAASANGFVKIYNCLFSGYVPLRLFGAVDVSNIVIEQSGTSGTSFEVFTSTGSISDLRIQSGQYALFTSSSYGFVIDGLVVDGVTTLVNSYPDSTGDCFLVDAVSNTWLFNWLGACTNEVYRQVSFDLFVLNGALTDFVEDANVTLSHDGVIVGSWLANSTGQIPTQTLTYGFYNQTGGDTMYGGTPWTLTITHPDWETYTSAFYPYSEIDWSISMQDTSTSNNNMLIVGLLVGSLAFLGLVVIRRKQN